MNIDPDTFAFTVELDAEPGVLIAELVRVITNEMPHVYEAGKAIAEAVLDGGADLIEEDTIEILDGLLAPIQQAVMELEEK